jgi:hypothetical protein
MDDRMSEGPEQPIDFSPIDPVADDLRFERLVRAINERAAPLLAARRAVRDSAVGELTRWWRPTIAAAVVVIAVSVAALAGLERARLAPSAGAAPAAVLPALPALPAQLADAMMVPVPLVRALDQDAPPAASDLLLSEAPEASEAQ